MLSFPKKMDSNMRLIRDARRIEGVIWMPSETLGDALKRAEKNGKKKVAALGLDPRTAGLQSQWI